eukprot:TRINITY_DN4523_c0_g1_i1.p1 TRINITY_DN4523_c0_g1~~TRINITY_DN4523_c0_g1_i1.p1  ORF type:complete len:2160 (+),score=806.54 TRINITY_DN4523_c0_g1_i1:122-6481(+)
MVGRTAEQHSDPALKEGEKDAGRKDAAAAATPSGDGGAPPARGCDLKSIAQLEDELNAAVAAGADPAACGRLRKACLEKVVENFSAPNAEPDMKALVETVNRVTRQGTAPGLLDDTFALCCAWLTLYIAHLRSGAAPAEEWCGVAAVGVRVLTNTLSPDGLFRRSVVDACAAVELVWAIFACAGGSAGMGVVRGMAGDLYRLLAVLPLLNVGGGALPEGVIERYLRMLCVGMTLHDAAIPGAAPVDGSPLQVATAALGPAEVPGDAASASEPALPFPADSAAAACRLLLLYQLRANTYAALYFLRSFINARPSVASSLVQRAQLAADPNSARAAAPHQPRDISDLDVRTLRGALHALRFFTFPSARASQFDLSTKEMLVVLHSFRYCVAYCGHAWYVVYDVMCYLNALLAADVAAHLETQWYILLSVLDDVLKFYNRTVQQDVSDAASNRSFVWVGMGVQSPGGDSCNTLPEPAVEAAVRMQLLAAAGALLKLVPRIDLDADRVKALGFAEACYAQLCDTAHEDHRPAIVAILNHQLSLAVDRGDVADMLRRRLRVGSFRVHFTYLAAAQSPAPHAPSRMEGLQVDFVHALRAALAHQPHQRDTFLAGLVETVYAAAPEVGDRGSIAALTEGPAGAAGDAAAPVALEKSVSSTATLPAMGRPPSPRRGERGCLSSRGTFAAEEWSAPVAKAVLDVLLEVLAGAPWAKGWSEGVDMEPVLRACLDVAAGKDPDATALPLEAQQDACAAVLRVASNGRCASFSVACCGVLWEGIVHLLAHPCGGIRRRVVEFLASLSCDAEFEIRTPHDGEKDTIGLTVVAREAQGPFETEFPVAAVLEALASRLLNDGEVCLPALRCLRSYLANNFIIMGAAAANTAVLAKLPKQLLALLQDPLDVKTKVTGGGLLSDIVGCLVSLAPYAQVVPPAVQGEFAACVIGCVAKALAKACEMRAMFPAGSDAVVPAATEVFGAVQVVLYQALRENDLTLHPQLLPAAASLLEVLGEVIQQSSGILEGVHARRAAPAHRSAAAPAALDATVRCHSAMPSAPASPAADRIGGAARQAQLSDATEPVGGPAAAAPTVGAEGPAGALQPPGDPAALAQPVGGVLHGASGMNVVGSAGASLAPSAGTNTPNFGAPGVPHAAADALHRQKATALSPIVCKQYIVALLSLLHGVAVSVLTDDDRPRCRLPIASLTRFAEAQTAFLFEVVNAPHDHRMHFLAYLVVSELLIPNRKTAFPLKHRQEMLNCLAKLTKDARPPPPPPPPRQSSGAPHDAVPPSLPESPRSLPRSGAAAAPLQTSNAELSRAMADLAWRTYFMGSADPYPQWDPLTEALFADGETQCFVTQGPHAPSVLSVTKGRAQHMLITIRSLASVVCWTCVLHNRPTLQGGSQCLGAGAQLASGRDAAGAAPAAAASASGGDCSEIPAPLSEAALQQDHDDFMRGIASDPSMFSSSISPRDASVTTGYSALQRALHSEIDSASDLNFALPDTSRAGGTSPRTPHAGEAAPRTFVPLSDTHDPSAMGFAGLAARRGDSPVKAGGAPRAPSPLIEPGEEEAPRSASSAPHVPPVYYPPESDVKLFTGGAGIATCREHHKPRCTDCVLLARQRGMVSVAECCRLHHGHGEGAGDLLPVRVCGKHRMTKCSLCRTVTDCCAAHHAQHIEQHNLKPEPLRQEEDWKDEVEAFLPKNASYETVSSAAGQLRTVSGFPVVQSCEDLSISRYLLHPATGGSVSPYLHGGDAPDRRASTPGLALHTITSYLPHLSGSPVPAPPSLSASEALQSLIELLGNSVHAAFILSIFKVNPPPVRLRFDKELVRVLSSLDRIPCKETHKIGVVYIDHNQYRPDGTQVHPTDAAKWGQRETTVLSNDGGSLRYQTFVNGLGRYRDLRVQREDPRETVRKGAWPHPCHYFGALDTLRQQDGPMCVMWESQVHQVVYHVATLMQPPETHAAPEPELAKQHKRIAADKKKRHIGNDHVVITYCEDPSMDINPFVLKNELNYINVLVQPLAAQFSRVSVHFRDCKEETARSLKELLDETAFGPALCRAEGGVVVPDTHLAQFVAQAALHASVATKSWRYERQQYLSNWGERLKRIEQLPIRFGVRSDQLSMDDTIVMGFHS